MLRVSVEGEMESNNKPVGLFAFQWNDSEPETHTSPYIDVYFVKFANFLCQIVYFFWLMKSSFNVFQFSTNLEVHFKTI